MRLITISLALTSAALLAVGLPSAAASPPVRGVTPAAVAATPTTSTYHPFSDPVYYPLHAAMWMNCANGNPNLNDGGRPCVKSFPSIDEVAPTADSHPWVYAMGAGIAHIQASTAPSCPASTATFGKSIWIDHGAGVTTRYGHLYSISVKEGQLVAVGQHIGSAGTSGKDVNCTHSYIDYEGLHHGISGSPYTITSLRACPLTQPTTTQSWPSALNPAWTSWQKVPMGGSPPNTIPAAAADCLPGGSPKTPNRPVGITLTRSGSGALTVRWASPSIPATGVVIQYGALVNGALPAVQDQHFAIASDPSQPKRITGLRNGTRYGFKISFHNAVGYGQPTGTYSAVPSA